MKKQESKIEESLVEVIEPLSVLAQLPENEFTTAINALLKNNQTERGRIISTGEMIVGKGLDLLRTYRTYSSDPKICNDLILEQVQKEKSGRYFKLVKRFSILANKFWYGRANGGEEPLSELIDDFEDLLASKFPTLVFVFSFKRKDIEIRPSVFSVEKDDIVLGQLNMQGYQSRLSIEEFSRNIVEVQDFSYYLETALLPDSFAANLQKKIKKIYLKLVDPMTDTGSLIDLDVPLHLIQTEMLAGYLIANSCEVSYLEKLIRAARESFEPEKVKEKILEANRRAVEAWFDKLDEDLPF